MISDVPVNQATQERGANTQWMIVPLSHVRMEHHVQTNWMALFANVDQVLLVSNEENEMSFLIFHTLKPNATISARILRMFYKKSVA